MKIEKGPGWDWTVTYLDDSGDIELMKVFGQRTIEDVAREARYSFGDDPTFAIVGIVRDDFK